MEPYAVVETGGKQYRVKKGDRLRVERIEGDSGGTVTLDRVLAVSDGTRVSVGTPDVDGARVTAQIVEQARGDKVFSFKKKRRKGYHKKIGHRQELTVLKVDDIQHG